MTDLKQEAREKFAEKFPLFRGTDLIGDFLDTLIDQVRSSTLEEKKHDCETWQDEGRGCTLCTTSTLPFEEFKKRIEYHSWRISDLNEQLDALRSDKNAPKSRMKDADHMEFYRSLRDAHADDGGANTHQSHTGE